MKPELELIRSGAISAEQYIEALERQQAETSPLGQVAIEEGVLSPRDVFEILHTQRLYQDRRFGDLAVQLGKLKRPDVALLLLEQLEQRRPILQHLVELGALSSEEANDWRSLCDVRPHTRPSSAKPAAALAMA